MDLIQCRVCRNHTYECSSLESTLSGNSNLTIADIIKEISSISCTFDDGLPYLICDSCLDELTQAYKFIQKIQESDRILHYELSEEIKEEIEFGVEYMTDEEIPTETAAFEVSLQDDKFEDPPEIEDVAREEFTDEEELEKNPVPTEIEDCITEDYIYEEELDFRGDSDDEYKPADDDYVDEEEEEQENQNVKKSPEKKEFKEKGSHLCSQCGKKFKRSTFLSNHIKFVHEKLRPFKCSECPKAYANKLKLREHFRTHTGERPYICDLCDLSFTREITMIRHRMVHTGELPFECKVCNKRFRQHSTLNGHMFVHTGVGVPCSICNKMFARKVDVKKHMVTHRKVK